MERAWVLCAAGDALCWLLGGRLAGVATPGWQRLALVSGVSAAAALWLTSAGMSLAALLLLPLGAAGCYGRMGPSAVLRCAVMSLLSALLLGGGGELLCRAGMSPRASVPLMQGCLLALCPLLSLLPQSLKDISQVELCVRERRVLLPAMLDSGNLLRDPVRGTPVIVASARSLRPLFPDARSLSDPLKLPQGFRLLSVRTAAGGALMPVFRPDSCTIYENGRPRRAEASVAVAPRQYRGVQALVPLWHLPAQAPQREARG